MLPKVQVSVLCSTERTGWLSPWLCSSLWALQKDPRFDITVEMVQDKKPVEYARNLCIAIARERGAAACVQIDNDMTLPVNFADILHDAITTGRAVVTLGCGVLLPEGPRILSGDNGRRDGNFRETGCGGGGVLIISSEVWRVIPRGPWFSWRFNDDEVLSCNSSEDYVFAEFVKSHGLKVWTHQSRAGHWKTCDATALVLQATGPARELEQLKLNIQSEAARQAVQMLKELKERVK